MKLMAAGVLIIFAAALVLRGQRARREYPVWEVRVLSPREVSPARHQQVDQWELDRAGDQGWELVSVAPHVYQNEERGPDGQKKVVTQVYPAYYFKRLKPAPER